MWRRILKWLRRWWAGDAGRIREIALDQRRMVVRLDCLDREFRRIDAAMDAILRPCAQDNVADLDSPVDDWGMED